MAILSPALLGRIRTIRTTLLNDVQTGFSPTAFVAWTKDRPATGTATWDNGQQAEVWTKGASGDGMIRNGQEMPIIGEGLITQEARYDFRTEKSYGLTDTHWLVIDGTRLFRVEGAPVEDLEKPTVTLRLVEVFGMTLPVAPPPPDPEVEP